jgi:nucleoside-diphosphate-sugar epimerase
MKLTAADTVLVTGAAGLVGSHAVEAAAKTGARVRALVRNVTEAASLAERGAELAAGDMRDHASLATAVRDATVVVHCAAKVGDWGSVEPYRQVNVEGTRALLEAAATGSVRRFVHISSLGVYEARDHHGTDETAPLNTQGIDAYTLTKIESERVVRGAIDRQALPAVILRPGFIYGPRDRTVLPRLLERLKARQVKFLGSGEQLMNNTFVGNLVQAVLLAIEKEEAVGQTFNITDGRLVSKREFMRTVAEAAGYPVPTASVPLPVARTLARLMEGTWKLLGKQQAPLLSSARIKFLGLNLDFCIDKARRELGYDPQIDFAEGMQRTIQWFRDENKLP